MNSSLTPSGNKFCYEQLTYTDSINNIKLSAKITVYAETGKIYSVENGTIIIDTKSEGNFNSNMGMNNDGAINITINDINIYHVGLVGDTIAAFISSAETYFKTNSEVI